MGLPRPRYPLPAGSFDRTRPVYPYPMIATYKGKGDPNVASSWTAGKMGSAKTGRDVTPSVAVSEGLTDWGGGYLRGGDSASVTPATSGAGTPKPNN